MERETVNPRGSVDAWDTADSPTTTAWRCFESPSRFERFVSNVRAARLLPQLTLVNLLEADRHAERCGAPTVAIWIGSKSCAAFADLTWTGLGFPKPVPKDALLRVPAWSILLEAEGVATYERAVAKQPPKKAQRLDLALLVYLAGARKRILATQDSGLLRGGNKVFAGRYENARVIHMSTLI